MDPGATANLEFDIYGVPTSVLSLSHKKPDERFLNFDLEKSTSRKADKHIKLIDKNTGKSVSDDPTTDAPIATPAKMLPDGKAGKLTIRCSTAESSASDKELGTFSYHPAWTGRDDFEPESYLIYLDLSLESFNVIERLTLAGRLPSMIRISTPDIELRFAMDNYFLYHWDLEKTARVAKVFGAVLQFPVTPATVKIENGDGSERQSDICADGDNENRNTALEAITSIGEVADRSKNIERILGKIAGLILLGLGIFVTFSLNGR